jgi:hypothetical protein
MWSPQPSTLKRVCTMATEAAFVSALKKMRRPGGRQLDFLRLHARSVGRASTMRRLAEQVGYADWRSMNLRYGLLARDIGRTMKVRGRRIGLLVEFVAPKRVPANRNISNTEYVVIMREPFAKALKAARWI